jgi:F-type H+-transporting ATPase subunit c
MDYLIGSVLAAAEAADPNAVSAVGKVAGANWAILGAVVACGIIIVGASMGIAVIGGRAVDSIARQPEAGGRIFSAMIIVAALVEGVTFFALLICFLAVYWLH